jgi:hypothetical protein
MLLERMPHLYSRLRLLWFLLITSVNSRAHLSYLTLSKPGLAPAEYFRKYSPVDEAGIEPASRMPYFSVYAVFFSQLPFPYTDDDLTCTDSIF